MQGRTWRMALALCLGLTLAGSAIGDEAPAASETQDKQDSPPADGDADTRVASSPIAFQIPNRGAPTSRLGGATRSVGANTLPRIEALVPEEPGWTLRAQPVLYWYLAATTDARIDFVLLRIEPMEAVAETTLARPERAGVQRLDLTEHGVELELGVSYQWLVKLVPNPEDRSYDRIVGGGIERVASTKDLEGKLAVQTASRPHVLAEAGVWYDAVDILSRGIDAEPGNRTLWNQRAALFQQVGLPAFPLEGGAAPGFSPR